MSRSVPQPSALEASILRRARELGLGPVGIADVHPSGHHDFLDRWLAEGYHGSMEYLAREDARQRRRDLRRTMEGVRSAVVVGQEYFQEDPPGAPGDPARGIIARYARGRDYHKVLGKKLDRLLEGIREEVEGRGGRSRAGVTGVSAGGETGAGTDPGTSRRTTGEPEGAAGEVRGRVYVDTGPILERELARRAGLGWFGKNTMLLHPRKGSYFFLGVLLLDLELEPSGPFVEDRCGTCSRCVDACPTDALLGRDADGAPVMDARRCISYLTIENRGPIPRKLRPLVGNRIYGCDICQEVCPFNQRFAGETAEPGYAARGPGELPAGVQPLPGEARTGSAASAEKREDVSVETPGRAHAHPGTDAPSLIELLGTALDADSWNSFSRGSAIRRAGRAGFARNVCVALGNWGSREAVSALSRALDDPDPLVRLHAAWALGRIGCTEASDALRDRLPTEVDDAVREEIGVALS